MFYKASLSILTHSYSETGAGIRKKFLFEISIIAARLKITIM